MRGANSQGFERQGSASAELSPRTPMGDEWIGWNGPILINSEIDRSPLADRVIDNATKPDRV